MNSQNSTECPQTSPEPTAVDLTAVEDRYRAGQGVDFTEVKEAMVDGLLRLTEQHCTGEGSDAEIIYGARPSSRLVSAFLLPRYDRSGNEDETSDIHIATMGVDLQVAAGTAGTVTIEPALSVYVRELPSWSEIADPRNDMMPQVQLSREARQAVEQRARQYIDEGIAALPPVEDEPQEDESERAGNALAQAERAHELAEVPDDSPETPATADELGTAQGNARAAESSERAAIQHQDRSRRRATLRNERNATVAMIRCEAFDRAFLELGIYVVDANGQAQRPLSAGDIEEAPHSELIETGIEDAQDGADATQPEATACGRSKKRDRHPRPAPSARCAKERAASRTSSPPLSPFRRNGGVGGLISALSASTLVTKSRVSMPLPPLRTHCARVFPKRLPNGLPRAMDNATHIVPASAPFPAILPMKLAGTVILPRCGRAAPPS